MIEKVRQIDPFQIDSLEEFRKVMVVVLNVVEEVFSENGELKKENQLLRDEINRLKGEEGKPEFKKGDTKKGDVSSGGKEKRKKNHKKRSKKKTIKIDKVVVCKEVEETMPADAVFKYYDEHIQQDVEITRKNVLYKVAVYYSPSERKTYRSKVPKEYKGQFGVELQSLLHVLYHVCNVPHSGLKKLSEYVGIDISRGSINNILMSAEAWALKEQAGILESGISQSAFTQTDSTSNKEKGRRKTTHIIAGDYFSVFYTLAGKSRLDVLSALQGKPVGGISVSYTEQTQNLLQGFGVAQADRERLQLLFAQDQVLSLTNFESIIEQHAPEIFAKPNMYKRIRDAFAISYYHSREDFPRADILLTDDAPEYKKVPGLCQALCWVHDARHYNKLTPKIELHQTILKNFQDEYWKFYRELLDFKELSTDLQNRQIPVLQKEFTRIFTQNTNYFQLDKLIQSTYKNKDKLLAVLNCPALPLHNNAAELGARRIVRKRDISLHTWSAKGTRVRDAFLSIVETAQKTGVNALEFIKDRVSDKFKLPSMGHAVKSAYQTQHQ